jgi:hypothetical protein
MIYRTRSDDPPTWPTEESTKDRYMIQYWDYAFGRFMTDCAFQNSLEQQSRAIGYIKQMMPADNNAHGRILDQQTGRVIFRVWREDGALCWEHVQ